MPHWIKDLFTCKDGVSFDVGRVLWVAVVLSLIGFEGFAVGWHGQAFDALQFASGAAAALAGGGAALGMKHMTEPQGESEHHDA